MMTLPDRSLLVRGRSATLTSVMVLLLAVVTAGVAMGQDATPTPDDGTDLETTSLPEGFDRKMADRVAKVIEAVHPVRGLPPASGVTYRTIDETTFRSELQALIREEYPASYVEAEDDAFTRLGLLGPDDDLGELILGIYDSQVLAFYDPRTKTFTLVGPVTRIGALESVVVAHEYGHALQDAAFDLEGLRIRDLDQSDAILAQQSLVEGDATAVMYDWAARELSLTDLLRVSAQSFTRQDQRTLNRLPMILRRQLESPYLDGFAFVNAIRGRGDWAAVDRAWDSPPVSTEQILHPELYPDELPVEIDLPDMAAALGPGWSVAYEQTLGELQIGVWVADGRKPRALFPVLPGPLPGADAAAGWGGDRLISLDGPDGTWAIVWQTEWDSRDDQAQFRKAARAAMEDLPGAHAVTNTDVAGGLSSPVLVLVADSEGTLDTLERALQR